MGWPMEGLSYRIEPALRLTAESRRAPMAAVAEHVRMHDVHRWVSGQLAADRRSRPLKAG